MCPRFQANKLYHIHSDYLFTELLLLWCDVVHGNENENRRNNEKHNKNNAVHGLAWIAHCIWGVDTSMSTFTRRWCVTTTINAFNHKSNHKPIEQFTGKNFCIRLCLAASHLWFFPNVFVWLVTSKSFDFEKIKQCFWHSLIITKAFYLPLPFFLTQTPSYKVINQDYHLRIRFPLSLSYRNRKKMVICTKWN